MPETLVNWNLTFTFSFSDLPGSSSNRVDLTLPYAALNLQLTYPFPNLDANVTSPPINYFPLRRAVKSDQYTIGRAFFQESYLTVDYERNNFSISQAKFAMDALTNTNLIPIPRPANSNWTGPADASAPALSAGVKAGAAVAAIVALTVGSASSYLFCLVRRRQQEPHGQSSEQTAKASATGDALNELSAATCSYIELPGNRRFPLEADTRAARYEMADNSPVEMPAEEVSPTSYAAGGGQRRTSSLRKIEQPLAPGHMSSPVPPPYSPTSDAISPSSPYPNDNTLVSHTTSSERQVSPVEAPSRGMSQTMRQGSTRIPSAGEAPFSALYQSGRADARSKSPLQESERGYRKDPEVVDLEDHMPAVISPDKSTRFSWE